MTTTELYLETETLQKAALALGVPGSPDGPPIENGHAAALRSAGLPKMADAVSAEAAAKAFLQQFGTADTIVLQGEVARVWQRFLPTVLTHNSNGVFVDSQGQHRDFDLPPQEIAELISWLLALGHSVEIWTPAGNTASEMLRADLDDFRLRRLALRDRREAEQAALAAQQAEALRIMMTDPAVVVKFGEGAQAIRIMVARWAEAQFMTFTEICAYVDRQWGMYTAMHLGLFAAPLTAIILSVGFVGWLWQAGGMLSAFALVMGLAGVVGLVKGNGLIKWINRVRSEPLPAAFAPTPGAATFRGQPYQA